MPEPSGDAAKSESVSARLREHGIVLPPPPTPLGSYIECNTVGTLLFVSGTLPIAKGRLAVSGRLGENISREQGQEAARIAALNALAAAKLHVGDIDRLKKLVKLTVLMASTEAFGDHAAIAEGASKLFIQIFGPQAGHVRLVYGVQSLPMGAPVVTETIFEIA